MADIYAALYTLLKDNSAVAALVGTRIYPIKMPQKITYPCVTYQKIATPRVYSMQGFSGLSGPIFEVTAWAQKQTDADALMEKIRLAIQGYRGTVSGVEIQGIIAFDEEHEYEDEPELYRATSEFRIWHNEL